MIPSLDFSRNAIKKRRQAAETPVRFQSMRKKSLLRFIITYQVAIVLRIGFKHSENILKTFCKHSAKVRAMEIKRWGGSLRTQR